MKIYWDKITAKDVIKAIGIFDEEISEHPQARNTFLLYRGKKYPAKHIRALAYNVAFGTKISKSEFSGGAETARFFENLGFTIEYKKTSNDFAQKESFSIPQSNSGRSIKTKNVIEQKNALQLVLNRYFNGDVVSEKTFDWMVTPENTNEYFYLINALHKYRGKTGFEKRKYRLRCDFVCEGQKLIFEYDERQHFTLARKVALESYPHNLTLRFNKQAWIDACEMIHANDNDPPNRDEIRAYYDSMRDILSAQNGYYLIRIMHGHYDWESPNAERYIEELLKFENFSAEPNKTMPNLKIGLYLQSYLNCNNSNVETRLKDVSKENLDILVFPETCSTPYDNIFYSLQLDNPKHVNFAVQKAMDISKKAKCAVIIGAKTTDKLIYNLYVNAFASDGETKSRFYIKHTMTESSPLGEKEYKNYISKLFDPIIIKDVKIGMTICYDCTHSALCRAWGKQDVNIIINSTGGNVVYHKWFRYNKARALENSCFSFCTMGFSDSDRINSYTFGFAPTGALMTARPLYTIINEEDKLDNIYIYNTNECDWKYEPDISLQQEKSMNSTGTWLIDDTKDKFYKLLNASECVFDNLYVLSYNEHNIVVCCINNKDILAPEYTLKLLYHPKIKNLKNKKYLIINVWNEHDADFFNTVISDILKVRSVENFCAVVYYSPEVNFCFQSGKNKNIQVIQEENNMFRLDLTRMSGPESIWKNKTGMRASWRQGYETLINTLKHLD